MATLTYAPQGFLINRSNLGAPPTYGQFVRYIKNGYGTNIFFGDLVQTQSSSNVGYLQPVTGTGQSVILGVFQGCEYFDTVQQRYVFSPWYSSTANPPGDVRAYVSWDPNTIYLAQTNGGTPDQTWIGKNIDVSFTAGSTVTGISKCGLASSPNTTSSLPLRIVNISNRFIPGSPQYDPVITNQDNSSTFPTNAWLEVTLNASEFNSTTGL